MIKRYQAGLEGEISHFIRRVFDQFIGRDYSEEGRETFYRFTSPESIRSNFLGQNLLLCHYSGDVLTGVIALRAPGHISLLFVDPQYHRQGIASGLFRELLHILPDASVHLSVNSSPYAVEAYGHLGFEVSDLEQLKDGIIYIPMRTTLDAGQLLSRMTLA